jgi:hypothetical protein
MKLITHLHPMLNSRIMSLMFSPLMHVNGLVCMCNFVHLQSLSERSQAVINKIS